MQLSSWLNENKVGVREFARHIDRSPATVSRLARGLNRPDWETADRIEAETNGEVTAADWPKPQPPTDAVTAEAAE